MNAIPQAGGTGSAETQHAPLPREVPTTMRAVVQDRYGYADALQLRQIELPRIGQNDMLVKVEAAAVDRGVLVLMTGVPYLARLRFGLRAPKQAVRGMDVAGRVQAVGAKVTRLRPGDAVMGIGDGTFAEYARARQDKLAHRPASLTAQQAAAVPISAITALQALRDVGRVKLGQRVLVIGASGGVGSYAVQLAKAFGAEVTGVCSTAKVEMVLTPACSPGLAR